MSKYKGGLIEIIRGFIMVQTVYFGKHWIITFANENYPNIDNDIN